QLSSVERWRAAAAGPLRSVGHLHRGAELPRLHLHVPQRLSHQCAHATDPMLCVPSAGLDRPRLPIEQPSANVVRSRLPSGPPKQNLILGHAFAFRDVDVRLRKQLPTWGTQGADLTLEVFNVFNYQNLGCWGGNTPFCIAYGSRRLQLGAGYSF